MSGGTAIALRPADVRRVARILRRLGALWEAPALPNVSVSLNPRLTRTLGRLVSRPGRIELNRRVFVNSKALRQVVTHEAAHAVLAARDGRTQPGPHGSEWRRLMALAGYPRATGARWRCRGEADHTPGRMRQPTRGEAPSAFYDHWCPVCQSSRVGRRPVNAWRCAACIAAGLDGRLEITRVARRPATAR